MLLKKITHGFAIQVFDTEKGRWTSQEFVAGDEVEYETEDGETIDDLDFTQQAGGGQEPYLPFDMVQPEAESTASLAEKLREVISDSGVFVTEHIEELIDLLEKAVVESPQELEPSDQDQPHEGADLMEDRDRRRGLYGPKYEGEKF